MTLIFGPSTVSEKVVAYQRGFATVLWVLSFSKLSTDCWKLTQPSERVYSAHKHDTILYTHKLVIGYAVMQSQLRIVKQLVNQTNKRNRSNQILR